MSCKWGRCNDADLEEYLIWLNIQWNNENFPILPFEKSEQLDYICWTSENNSITFIEEKCIGYSYGIRQSVWVICIHKLDWYHKSHIYFVSPFRLMARKLLSCTQSHSLVLKVICCHDRRKIVSIVQIISKQIKNTFLFHFDSRLQVICKKNMSMLQMTVIL